MSVAWQSHWPFRSREHAVAYEGAYCARHYQVGRGRKVTIVTDADWQLEDWLERDGAARLRDKLNDRQAIRSVYLWKVGANIRASGQQLSVPEELLSSSFAQALESVLRPNSDDELIASVRGLTGFPGVRVLVASAFAFWLRPNDYQLIDERSTAALGLAFAESDYSPKNYARWCALARVLSAEHTLSLREVDRALFAYHKLLLDGILLDA
jgi:hypothetical protein